MASMMSLTVFFNDIVGSIDVLVGTRVGVLLGIEEGRARVSIRSRPERSEK